MDDLDLINSVEQVEVMVNSIQKGAENQIKFWKVSHLIFAISGTETLAT